MGKVKRWIRDQATSFIYRSVVVGGHCGLCGKWVPGVPVPRWWQWTICQECKPREEHDG